MSFDGVTHWQVFDEAGRRKYLTHEEHARFLEAADRLLPQPQAILCHLLAFTGCRISEALALGRHQLDSSRQAITFRTLKRRRTMFRTVPVPDHLMRALLQLPKNRSDRLWEMHRTTAWRTIKRVMESASVNGPMATCKGLRHGFGIEAAAQNIPPNLIQRWLGHRSPSTTAIYLDAVGLEERAFACRLWSRRGTKKSNLHKSFTLLPLDS